MNSKKLIWIFMAVGSLIGGFIPSLWGADSFSLSPLIFGSIGGIIGIYIGYKIIN
jgi:xanthosine utilization system XapX-like protein